MGSIGRLGLQGRIENPLLQFLIQDTSRTFSFRIPLDRFDTTPEKCGPSRIYGGPGQARLPSDYVVRSSLMCQQNDPASPRDTLRRCSRPGQHCQLMNL